MCFKCLTHWIGSSDSDFVLVFKCYYIIIYLAIIFRFKLFETQISFIWLCYMVKRPNLLSIWSLHNGTMDTATTQPFARKVTGLLVNLRSMNSMWPTHVHWVGSGWCYRFLGWFFSFRFYTLTSSISWFEQSNGLSLELQILVMGLFFQPMLLLEWLLLKIRIIISRRHPNPKYLVILCDFFLKCIR